MFTSIWFFVLPGFFGRSSASVPFPHVSSPVRSASRRLPLLSDHSQPFSSPPESRPSASQISSAESEQRRDHVTHASAEFEQRLGIRASASPPGGEAGARIPGRRGPPTDQDEDVDGRRYGRNVDHDVRDLLSAREGYPGGERAAPPAPPPRPSSTEELPSSAARNNSPRTVQLRPPADLQSLHRRLATVAAANLQKAKKNRHRARVNYACTGSALAISTTLFIWQNHLSRDSGLVLELGSKSAAIFGLLLADQLIRIGTELLWRGAKGRQQTLGCMMCAGNREKRGSDPERRTRGSVGPRLHFLSRRNSFVGRVGRVVKNWCCARRCFRAERAIAGDEDSDNGEVLDASRSIQAEEVLNTNKSLPPQEQRTSPRPSNSKTVPYPDRTTPTANAVVVARGFHRGGGAWVLPPGVSPFRPRAGESDGFGVSSELGGLLRRSFVK